MVQKINNLVVNGCSYIDYYAQGNGHVELAQAFNIEKYLSLARPGSCNSRLIRTTLEHSYTVDQPTLYVIGATFLNRFEFPIGNNPDTFEERWISNSGIEFKHRPTEFLENISIDNINKYVQGWNACLNQKSVFKDYQWRWVSMIDSLKSRGHRVLVYNTAEYAVQYWTQDHTLDFLKTYSEIVNGFDWYSIKYQFEKGAAYLAADLQYDEYCRHVAPGHHRHLNDFIVQYIKKHKILE